MTLSLTERLILRNQYLILEKLYPDEAESLSQTRTALEMGFTRQYGDLFESLCDEVSEETQQEVIDVLNMYRAMLACYQDLKDRQGIPEHDLRFPGFDANEETSHYSYANYMVKTLGRFQESDPGKNETVNSHFPQLRKYRSMLREWNSAGARTLTKEQLLRIIEADR